MSYLFFVVSSSSTHAGLLRSGSASRSFASKEAAVSFHPLTKP